MRRLIIVILLSVLPGFAQQGVNVNSSASGTGTGAWQTMPFSVASKVVNGVSYSNLYSGSTLDVRVNACLSDAATRANGNTSGICDSTGDGGTQTIANQISVGNGTNDVTWILPEYCAWSVTGAGGAYNAAISQEGYSSIIGSSVTPNHCTITNNTANNAIGALYKTNGSGYYRAEGFQLVDSPQTSYYAVMMIDGALDTSFWKNIAIYAYFGGQPGLLVGNNAANICCSANFDNIQINMNSSGGPALDIQGSTSSSPIALWFNNSSFTHPGATYPAVLCNDTNTDKSSQVVFNGTYIEADNTDTTTPLIKITGCGQVGFHGLNLTDPSTASTASGITVASGYPTSLTVDNMTQYAGFTQPATAVVNSDTGETVKVDADGHLTSYRSNLNYATSLLASGILDGQAPVAINAAASFTFGGGTYQSGYTISNDGSTAVTGTLPVAAAGKQYCVRNIATSTSALTIQTSGTGQYIDNAGAYTASGGYVVSSGALADAACVVAIDATHWELYVQSGTWATH